MGDRTSVLFSVRDDPQLLGRAEELGYESVWAAEGQGRTAFGKLERWAVHTSEIGLATGIVNIYSRTPAALAQAIATLDDHSDGRAILGLGVAHPGVVETFHGMAFERPLTRVREYITLVRRYLAGTAGGFDGEFYAPERTAFWDAFDPVRSEIPIYNAALGPQNIELTGEMADGWLPNLFPEARLESAQEWLEAGAARAERSAEEVDRAMYVLTSVHPDPEVARQMAREHIAYYIRDIPGFYGRVARNSGYGRTVDAVENAPTPRAGAEAVSDEMVEHLAIVGRPTEAGAALDELRALGVDLPIVRAPIGADAEDVGMMLEAFAPDGR